MKALFAALGLVWEKLPEKHRWPASFIMVGGCFLYYFLSYLIFDFPEHAKRAYDNRWYANAAPLINERKLEFKDLSHRIDRIGDSVERQETDMKMMKECIVYKRCIQP